MKKLLLVVILASILFGCSNLKAQVVEEEVVSSTNTLQDKLGSTPALTDTPATIILTPSLVPNTPTPFPSTATSTPFPPTATPTATRFPAYPISQDNLSGLVELKELPKGYPPKISWVAGGKEIAIGFTSGTYIFDTQSKKQVRFIKTGTSNDHDEVAFSPDGEMLAVNGCVWNLNTGEKSPIGYSGHHAIFSQDGSYLASVVAKDFRSLKTWRINDGKEISNLAGEESDFFSKAISPDGKTLASSNLKVKLWDFEKGSPQPNLPFAVRYNGVFINQILFSPDGKYLAGAVQDGNVYVWKTEDGRLVNRLSFLPTKKSPIRMSQQVSLAFSSDSMLLATGGSKGDLWVCEVITGKLLFNLKAHSGEISSLSFSPDNKFLATVGPDQMANIIDASTGEALYTFTDLDLPLGHSGGILDLGFSPDGNIFASGSNDMTAKIWDVDSGNLMRTFQHDAYVDDVAISPDNKILATGTTNDGVRLWDITSGSLLFKFMEGKEAQGIAFSPNGKFFTASNDYSTLIWDPITGREIAKLQRCRGICLTYDNAFSPDGKLLAVGEDFGVVKLWNTGSWTLKSQLNFKDGSVLDLAFSPDGKYLAGSDWTNNKLVIWNISSGRLIHTIKNYRIFQLSFSPDGKMLFLDTGDSIVTLDVKSGNEIKIFTSYSGPIAFSPNGMALAVVDYWRGIIFLGIP